MSYADNHVLLGTGSGGTLLVFPPNFSFKQPYLSTPALTAYLRAAAAVRVEQRDLNIEALRFFLSQNQLHEAYAHLRSIGFRASTPEHRRAVSEALLGEDLVLDGIEDAMSFLRTPHTVFDPQEYAWALRVIEAALEAVSARYWPTRLTLTSFGMRYSPQSSAEIFEAVGSPENPYIEFFEQEVVGTVVRGGHDLVGLSVAALSQIIPALTLAARLKRALPDLPVVIGGGVFQRLSVGRSLPSALFDIVDFFVIGEGERPLAALYDHVVGRRAIEDVPGLVYRSRGTVRSNPSAPPLPVGELPPPDYDGLPLESYLTPRPVLSYQPVRGCYWRECTFCNQHVVCGDRADEGPAEKTVRDLVHLARRYSTDAFCLVNESLSPGVLRAIARRVEGEKVHLLWYAGARFDKGFDKETIELLGRAGCRKLFFGLESGSRRILRAMRKGISPKHAADVLRWSQEAGVASHVYAMLGFPGESRADIDQTRGFLDRVLPEVDRRTFTIYASVFQLKPDTAVFSEPASFGIEEVIAKTECDLEYIYEHRTPQSAALDYEQEAENLVEHVDAQLDELRAPEDICHFLTMGNLPRSAVRSDGVEDEHGDTLLMLGRGVRLVAPSPTLRRNLKCGSDTVLFLYHFAEARLYAVASPAIAEVLRTLERGTTRAEAIRMLRQLDEAQAEAVVHDLIKRGLATYTPVHHWAETPKAEVYYVP